MFHYRTEVFDIETAAGDVFRFHIYNGGMIVIYSTIEKECPQNMRREIRSFERNKSKNISQITSKVDFHKYGNYNIYEYIMLSLMATL